LALGIGANATIFSLTMEALFSLALTAAGVSVGLAVGWFATKPLATFWLRMSRAR
jgi:hypothetical protein